jgi:NADH-quinone oxidoreductase subunit L
VLAFGAVLAGWFFYPYFIGYKMEDFWGGVIANTHGEHEKLPAWVIWAPVVVTVAGFLLALPFYLFSQTAGAKVAKATGPLHAFLYNKWYFDEIYNAIFVKGAKGLGDLFWKGGDQKVIDGVGPNGVAWLTQWGARQLRKLQTGFVYHYSFVMLIGVVAFGAYALWVAMQGAAQ